MTIDVGKTKIDRSAIQQTAIVEWVSKVEPCAEMALGIQEAHNLKTHIWASGPLCRLMPTQVEFIVWVARMPN